MFTDVRQSVSGRNRTHFGTHAVASGDAGLCSDTEALTCDNSPERSLGMVVRGGVEPPTFRVSVGRSYQLSYLTMDPTPARGEGSERT